MTAATEPPPRIATLDIVRGIAVMGILAMNIVAFAMPFQAYLNPMAYGLENGADFASWVVSFIFVDGKMRGLFSFLFGASMLLVIERAQAGGHNAASIHYRRMFWLLVFGLIHLYLIWYGDILVGYALVGMVAWFFRNKEPRALIRWGIGLLTVQLIVFAILSAGAFHLESAAAAPGATADAVKEWRTLEGQFGVLGGEALATKLGLFRGDYLSLVENRLSTHALAPVKGLLLFGWETLAYFLFGMVALRNGFLRGGWSDSAYRRTALIGFGLGVPAYALLAWILVRDDFSVPMVMAIVMAATVPVRPLLVVATAALIVLLTRRGGALVERIAAAGRAAFTNYLGTSLLMTSLFYGYGAGLFGNLSRVELWLPVIAMWALMLIWSKPWLDRFQYGPLEWLWRSLSRGSLQPMRRLPVAPAQAGGRAS
ncbi:MAG TPA: DUF418 domain-containing protein [Allosphingosinicella sp.]